jgi:hypothetical protein
MLDASMLEVSSKIAVWTVAFVLITPACDGSSPAPTAQSAAPVAAPSGAPSPYSAPASLPEKASPIAICEARCRRFLSCQNDSLSKRGSGSPATAGMLIERCVSRCPEVKATANDDKVRQCLAKPTCATFESCLGFPPVPSSD